ncbi:thiamine diphosphokinase [Sinisalibacter aestuarii]|uniref:Thiamine diphosphokinase n=1 Tax=Sinisalibacter aestuarii TaxID=2949426 RepID=A0ABQ5LUJ5_9RHOB|nr:thiamine diphosphokinase [Sinisalibacter aestuarii]GKY88649.1 thiamine pyrophosphokinase [Sinisalibacter aestuarii]
MKAGFAPFSEKVTLLGGGELTPASVSDCLTRAPNLVVCDGAAARALEIGLMPQRVVGDMDSLDDATRARLDPAILHEIAEQESTDFEKALSTVEAPLILGAGFMGGRLDHELACYNALVRHAGQPCILVGERDICFHAPKPVSLMLPVGMRVSLFPMAEVVVDGAGLEWPLDRLRLAPWGRVGTSNRAVAERVEIAPNGHGLLVILPRAGLDAAIAALAG